MTPTVAAPATDVVALERAATRGWAADVVEEHPSGWLLRAADGFTGRANSALVLAEPRDRAALHAVLADVVDWYGSHGLPARVSVPLPTFAAVETAMLDAGWRRQWGAHVMVRGLEGLSTRPGTPPVEIATTPSEEWTARYHYRGGELPPAAVRVLARGDQVGFAAVRDRGSVVAIARGAITDGWLGITAVETRASHRRRGLASAVLAALAEWARDRGASRAYLQVDLANENARTMYEHAGFTHHHHYHYLGHLEGGEARSPESC